jgi:hypothetical protein
MCKCTPEIRTLWCRKGDCQPPEPQPGSVAFKQALQEEEKKIPLPANPPAFPVAEDHKTADLLEWTSGMTLRDYFAAAALQGMLANEHGYENTENADYKAEKAYYYADGMLRQRAKDTK